ncbi:L-2-hydroxyglutarate oxidase [Paracoccus methylarcula]|uniref:L-2-hydroxyglutarate oxidase n=1 Tax=Paracoccus methylarcula TaxID=72022 RepID=A0A3R7M826_9RHOB|nr:L-2-hydroxyglutarate oxidase [Paracoccus methylarcula]RNF33605.1 L-2-hydroxyglutarate oxidase [Paracoccus methylarcula]
MTQTADIVIAGGGIVGLATAVEIQNRLSDARVTVLEKEPAVARHQSGRNSGVIHAGLYYAPGSLKAWFCRAGVTATERFCTEERIPFERCGKLVVATNEAEAGRLADLAARARGNGIEIEEIDRQQSREMEPNINSVAAIFSPTTGIVDFAKVTERLARIFQSRGGMLRTGVRLLSGRETGSSVRLRTSDGELQCDRFVACAGLHSDRLIRAFGHDPGYRVVPFRGEYFRIHNQPPDLVRHLIYPVPDPERPFLGVHLTRKMDGGFTVGPNAVLACKREGYGKLAISPRDMLETALYPGFWRMIGQNFGPAVSELRSSILRRQYLRKVHAYCPRIRLEDLGPYRPGIRAQAVAPDGGIIDDFLFVETERCAHVGNAPSPAATSAFPIAEHIADRLL